MSKNVEHCTRSSDLAAAAMIMWRNDCGVVPVLDDERRVVGVVTDRDICMAVATRHRRPEDIRVAELATDRLHAVTPDSDLREALELMKARQVRRLPVTDARGALRGMLSLSDIIRTLRPVRRRGAGELSAAEIVETLQAIGRHSEVPEALPVG
ncbi:MAG TPA: CBS domain-containing protein [Candidatus Eisenbacteria bacterium]